jgi:cytochrome c oxidase subunit 2
MSTPASQIDNSMPKGEHYLLEVDHPMVLPINKKIRFLMTSSDVIHEWWVPAFGAKRNAIPGFIREIWATIEKPGTYRGQCSELCGKGHGFMPIVVEAVSEEKYQEWVASMKMQTQPEVATGSPAKGDVMQPLQAKARAAGAMKMAAVNQIYVMDGD